MKDTSELKNITMKGALTDSQIEEGSKTESETKLNTFAMASQTLGITTSVAIEEDEVPLSNDFYYDQIGDATLRTKLTSTNIAIPLKEEGEEVDIDSYADLPDDPTELSTLLTNEECTAKYWILVAKAYASQGKVVEALVVIDQAMKSPFAAGSSKQDYIDLNNYAAWLNIMKADLFDDLAAFELAASEIKAVTSASMGAQNPDYNILAETVLSLTSMKSKSKKTVFEQESRNFDTLLKRNPKNCYALLGKGKLYFYRQNYHAALKIFQRVLQLNPLVRPDPRIGIGLCYWFLERKDLANQSWQNSIQVHPERNLEAKILISIAKFDECFMNSTSDDDFKIKYTEAMGFATASYKEDPSNRVIQLILASYYFSKGETTIVEKICDTIINDNNTSSFVKSEALFWTARCKLVSGDILQAQKSFSDAIRQNEGNILARVGYSQCLVIRGEINDAIRALERVQELNSKILEVTYALGMLYSRIEKFHPKAIIVLEKYVKIADDQNESVAVGALITLSKLYESSDIAKALEFSLKAKEEELAAGKSEDDISAILYNNIGVFSLLENHVTAAENYFEKAYNNVKQQYADDPTAEKAFEITLKYNIARAKESTNEVSKVEEAVKLYSEIMENCPHYTSAKIRWLTIACLSKDKNVKEEVQKLLEEEADDLEIRSFYGWYLKKFASKHGLVKDRSKDLESEHHRETLTKYTSHDCYALISMANVYCSLARETKEQQKKDQYYIRAAQLYQKVLNLDPKNAYAAQGIAIIFAEEKQTGLALEIFRKVRDSLNDITVYLNLGHCLLEVKQFSKAIESYELALTRFTDGNDARLLNYFARAWLLRGTAERNMECYRTALKYVNKSYELHPTPAYQFNITYIEYQLADFIRKLPASKRTMEDLEVSIKGLEEAIVILDSMAEDSSVHPPYPVEDLKLRSKMGTSLLKQLEKALDDQKEHEQGFESKLKEAKRLKGEEDKQREAAKFKEEEEQKKVEEKLLAERKALEQQQQEWNLLRMEEAKDSQDNLEGNGEPKEKKKRGRKKKDADADAEGDEPSTKKRKGAANAAGKKSSLSKEFIDDSDEEAEYNDDYDNDDDDDKSEAKSSDNEDDAEDGDAKKDKIERKKVAISDDEEEEEVAGADSATKADAPADAGVEKEKSTFKATVDDEDEDEDGLF